mgnify:CR=1 FL=1
MPVEINELVVKTSVNNDASKSPSVKEGINYQDIEKIKKIILQECRKMVKEEMEMDKIR